MLGVWCCRCVATVGDLIRCQASRSEHRFPAPPSYGVINYGSGRRKDVVNQCLEFVSGSVITFLVLSCFPIPNFIRKFSRRSCRDWNPRPFDHESGVVTTELSRFPSCGVHKLLNPFTGMTSLEDDQ